ncbi:AIM24 family protein [Virgibacillus sp. LDC1]|uniref:AIM24 family protein n=1 Tax=Paenibacillus TaxID=44249 RepID=UPI002DB677DD|nr:AIM24 family protein [Paenibacillus lautus]MCV4234876.1 AIM24 family protein [Virgibacillus sp. LDC1]MEC0203615.1 AIM24 family protein [Paenibacillus lautus]MEC0309794.1 AIM24 family protein [Paenibacillus lautus]
MIIRMEDAAGSGAGQAVTFSLTEGDTAHVLHPEQIVAYRGPSSGRSDRLMNVKGIYRKKKWIRADITGPSQFTAALPPGFNMHEIQLEGEQDMLYDFRHVFFYTQFVTMQTRILKIKNMLVTRDAIKMKFSGNGSIGILTQGPVCKVKLHPTEPLYVDAGSIIAYPEAAKLDLTVYGNHLASQHMNYHWKLTGDGYVLFQAGRQNQRLVDELNDEGIIKRFLREAIPFGGVFIK